MTWRGRQEPAGLRRCARGTAAWEALFVDDSSTDSTPDLLGSIEGGGISVLRTARRSGKIGALRLAARSSSHEILVVTDCGSRISPEGLGKLVAWFEDPRVGLATGTYLARSSRQDARAEGEGAYWSAEARIREAETSLGSTTHATGAFLAVRAELFARTPWPEGTTNDDIHLPVQILAMGYDVVCEPGAVAVEEVDTDRAGEFRCRARIAAGNFQMIAALPALLRAGRWFPAIQLLSHKLLRNAVGIPLVGLALATLAVLDTGVGQALLAAQMLCYLVALVGFLPLGSKVALGIPARASYLLAGVCASAWGLVTALARVRRVTWERTDSLAGAGRA